MKWTIAYDSGCDRRETENGEDYDLHLVPLKLRLGEDEVTDDGTTSLEELQSRLDARPGKTGTACPSVGEWQRVMEEEGGQIIAITISGAVSGSFQSACIARDLVLEEYPEKKICVIDSVSGSGTMEFMVRRAERLIRAGRSFEEVCRELEGCRGDYEIFFLLKNVDNIMSNGRLNPIVGRAVKAMKLCLLATVSPEGTLEVIAKVRGFEKAMDRSLAESVSRGCTPRRVIISHCLNESGAELLRDKVLEQFPEAEVEITRTGLLCGYYAEKGGLILAMER